ncbi:hypothetical protein QR685DRAFT_29730 [Neurospora intermedia]|uniref:Uncharacterized protein n=1 Tax=Neurospora intermedia TaxID=5142 RepID=A0ABR3DQN1_NEUIN
MACSRSPSCYTTLQLRKSRVVVGRGGGRGRLVGRVTVPGALAADLRTEHSAVRVAWVSPLIRPALPFSFASFPSKAHTFLHRSRVRPTSGSRARVRFPLALVGGSQGSRFGRVRSAEKLLTEKSPLLMAMSNAKHHTCIAHKVRKPPQRSTELIRDEEDLLPKSHSLRDSLALVCRLKNASLCFVTIHGSLEAQAKANPWVVCEDGRSNWWMQ